MKTFLNDDFSLTKNGFVLVQFIAPRTFSIRCISKFHEISVMVVYLSELILYQINLDSTFSDKVSIARHGDLALQIPLIGY